MPSRLLCCALVSFLLLGCSGLRAEDALELSPAEASFAKSMSGATMAGAFTVSDAPEAAPRSERYDLGEVRKVSQQDGRGLWLFPTRIRYGDKDVTLPITLPVEFAGDAAVIRVDKIGFPGLGVYSARVLVHGGKYAGYWEGSGHGGHLFGVLEKKKVETKETPSNQEQ
jgi:hypothetical protein